MKHVWMIVSTLAIANVLAIAGLVGWLHTSHRLNKERVQAIRTMLATTAEQEQAAKAAAEAKVAEEQKKAAEEARQAVPPVPAADRIAEAQLVAEKQMQAVLRQKQELENLRAGLMRQLADLEQREKKLADEQAAFGAERRRIAEVEGAQQFKTALAALESQKAKDAKAVLKAMMEGGRLEQVVSYLARMDESKRGKVLAEFVKDEPGVAADLLERLRTRGLSPGPAAGAAPGARTDAATDDQRSLPAPARSTAAR